MSYSRRNPTAAIDFLCQNEEKQADRQKEVKRDQKFTSIANWEQSSSKKFEATEYFNVMDKVEARQNDVLVRRRQQLANLLRSEQEKNDNIITNMVETDAERKASLLKKARETRDKRDQERKEMALKKVKQLALENSAAVRMATSHLKVLQVSDGRFEQLAEKEVALQRKKDSDLFYNEQLLEELAKKNARARADLEQQYQLTKRTMEAIAVQQKYNSIRNEEEKARKKAENEEFFRLLHEEERKEVQKQAERRRKHVEIMAEMIRNNEELKRIQKEEFDKLKAEDKKLLEDIMLEVQKEKAAEEAVKGKRHEDMLKYMHELSTREAKEKANVANNLDCLWQEEADKAWDKREAQWRADQERREALLRSVFATRREQIKQHLNESQQGADRKRQEHDELVAQIRKMRAEDLATLQGTHDLEKKLQSCLKQQIAAREEEKRQAAEDWNRSLTDTQAQEQAMANEIAEKLANLEAAKPERYKHVPLIQQKKGLAGLENL